MRKKLIAANWKMYKTPDEAKTFVKEFIPLVSGQKHADIVLCASPTLLPAVVDAARNNPIRVSAQDMHWMDQGAYTGETSPLMLKALGVTHVLIGHSERRQYFNETDESVNLKLKSALAHGLTPIVCVGELLAERESNQTEEVLVRQTSIGLSGIDASAAAPIVIAYEPVWRSELDGRLRRRSRRMLTGLSGSRSRRSWAGRSRQQCASSTADR